MLRQRSCWSVRFRISHSLKPDRWDRLIRQLDERNKKYQRSKERKNDPRAGVARKQTRWPGQHLCCGVCGRIFVHGGHGRKGRMMCNGAREYTCWNAMSVDAAQVADVVTGEIRELVRELPSFDKNWVTEYENQRAQLRTAQDAELGRIAKELAKEKRVLENFLEALAKLGSSPSVLQKVKSSESKVQLLEDQKHQLEARLRTDVRNCHHWKRSLPCLMKHSAIWQLSARNLED